MERYIIEQIKNYLHENYSSEREITADLNKIVRFVYNRCQMDSITEAHRLVLLAVYNDDWIYYDDEEEAEEEDIEEEEEEYSRFDVQKDRFHREIYKECMHDVYKKTKPQPTIDKIIPKKLYEEKSGSKRKIIILNEEE